MNGNGRQKQKRANGGRSNWALLVATVSFLATGFGNVLTWRKINAETEKVAAEAEQAKRDWRKTQAETANLAAQNERLLHDEGEREERSARAWLELIRMLEKPEDRVLALKLLYETSPYESIRNMAKEAMLRALEAEELKRERQSLETRPNAPAVERRLQRVRQAQVVLHDLFGPFESQASGRNPR